MYFDNIDMPYRLVVPLTPTDTGKHLKCTSESFRKACILPQKMKSEISFSINLLLLKTDDTVICKKSFSIKFCEITINVLIDTIKIPTRIK